jgi:stearoyl-CoA desaturase (delta-9 desaturase)
VVAAVVVVVVAAVVAAAVAVAGGNAGKRLANLESSINRASVDSSEPTGARGAPPSGGPKQYPYSGLNCGFLLVVHLTALVGGGLYVWKHGLHWGLVALTAVLTVFTILSLSAGYHRLFSHKTYEAHPAFRAFLLIFGAAAFQNSAITWAADHRRHHRNVDTDDDPYNARRGFWYSHVGWVLRKTEEAHEVHPVPDLWRDPLIRWQHQLYMIIGTVSGFVLPILISWLAFHDALGGLLIAGAFRVMFVWHVTFSINSFAHMIGSQPYSDRNTSRDSLFTAVLSLGEGYHNFHHTFPVDYRNGVRRRDFDPSKWTIRAASMVGLTRNLRRTPKAIVLRARLRMEARRLEKQPVPAPVRERLEVIKAELEQRLARWHTLAGRFEALRSRGGARARRIRRRLQVTIRHVRRDLDVAQQAWRETVRAARLDIA